MVFLQFAENGPYYGFPVHLGTYLDTVLFTKMVYYRHFPVVKA